MLIVSGPKTILLLVGALLLTGVARTPNVPRDAKGRIERSQTERNEFKRLNPCPSMGKPSGPCPGYVIDHIDPLCKGGSDLPANMQYQRTADAKAKDRVECK